MSGAQARPARAPRETVEVTRPTSNATLLARGLARAATGGAKLAGALPDVVLVRRGVQADPAVLAAYLQLVGEEVRDVLPAGYLHTLAFPVSTAMLARPDFPLPALGMVHLANRAEVRRPVGVDEVLDARVHAENLVPHRRGTAVDVVAELATDGEVVWRGVSTYLARGVRVPGADRPDDARRPEWHAPEPTGLWRLGADVGRRYAEVSGDHNPIHTSRVAARAFGFARPIAHGMFTAAKALADVGPAGRGDAYAWEVEFATPVLLPATVSVCVTPDDGPGAGDAAGAFTFAAWSRKPHLTGSVRPLR
ncbi:MaoC family dehydratase [Actinotalea fermentans]|uniref:MaoC-like domain-containing protein n=1 Tax=Actinotalea fermentans TaxID=43671 RepID=A0A511YYQ8_9CELL|nr:MaoC/PaaZ C-terminal domain-containing protein [Actinotalea fermentans]KGM15670.1 hypothetical protein N867_06590 [Actinotalea fermentans ATCC 43279 = JCM 9966 = DSM 3133]GEN80345.1 hypothetical protein AFE02nite_20790 [Actinotalea fermentans]